jgi:hypothetical protein
MTDSIPLLKYGGIIANFVSIASFAFYLTDRTSSTPRGFSSGGLNVVLHLTLVSAITYGILWSLAEQIFGWTWGTGGGKTPPSGWAAVVLSLCMTLPLALVPFVYQKVTNMNLLSPLHWRAIFLVSLLCAGAHLAIFGPTSDVPGLRQRIAPTDPHTSLEAGLTMEAIFTVTIIGLLVLPYRLTVDRSESWVRIGLGRVLLPCIVYFSGMVVFTVLRYPGSLTEPGWVQVRGIVAGLLIMFCLCGGMFS